MTARTRAMAIWLVCALATAGCRDTRSSTPPQAKVDHPVKESELSTVTLSPEAEARLGIEVEPVSAQPVPETRDFAGEIIVPPGMTLEVSAPVAGTLLAGRDALRAGMSVRKGQALLDLVPLLPSDRDLRSAAERDVAAASATASVAEKKAARAERMLHDGSGSRRSLEEAEGELARARAGLAAANDHLRVVNRSPIGDSSELVVSSPIDGIVQTVWAVPGQTVAASSRLLALVSLERLWVRVPIYAGDVRGLDASLGADVRRLGATADAPVVRARAVAAAPPSADPRASTVDAMFALPSGASFQPGERVMVRLTGRSRESAASTSESALLYDFNGGSWIYERTAPHIFARRRVEVRDTIAGRAVLARGPAEGTMVVTTGAAELYGIEFGSGK